MEATYGCNLAACVNKPAANESRRPFLLRGCCFIAALILFAGGATLYLWHVVPISGSNITVAVIWLGGFFVLTLNVAYMLLTACIALAGDPPVLPEASPLRLPECDLVFVVKDEPPEVFDNMRASLAASLREGTRLILISNSTNPEILRAEAEFINRMAAAFGAQHAEHWCCPHNPTGRKHTAVQQWLREGPASPYCLLCDADTVVPAGAVDALLRKGEHPDNADIAVFQGQLRVGKAGTIFARGLRFGMELAQRVYMVAYQRVFGCCPYFGHGALLRRDQFKWLRVPAAALSHDVWDMALLSRRGLRVAFCHDVHTYEELPGDYLEAVRRDRRWAEGTIQSLSLLRMPGISLAAWFFILFGAYTYVSQVIFLAWFLFGFFIGLAGSPQTAHVFQPLAALGAGSFVLDGGTLYLPILLVVFFHRLPFCRRAREVWETLREMMMSTIIFLNSLVYSSVGVILAPFGKRLWIPMGKGHGSRLTFRKTLRSMWPTFILGLALFVGGILLAPGWATCAAPVLVAFTVGPVAVYLTAKPVKSRTGHRGSLE